MPTSRTPRRPKAATDDRLLATALEHFGQRGLDGASTRDIARAAGTVMSSITYHYGSKQGLYLATARYVARQMAAHLDPALDAAAPAETLDRAGAVEAVANAVDVVVRFMLQPESAPLARFILREQMASTEAFEILRDEIVAPFAARLTALVARAGDGRWDAEEARIKTLAIFGQCLVFRVAQATVLAVTGWSSVTTERTELIVGVVQDHVRAILDAEGGA